MNRSHMFPNWKTCKFRCGNIDRMNVEQNIKTSEDVEYCNLNYFKLRLSSVVKIPTRLEHWHKGTAAQLAARIKKNDRRTIYIVVFEDPRLKYIDVLAISESQFLFVANLSSTHLSDSKSTSSYVSVVHLSGRGNYVRVYNSVIYVAAIFISMTVMKKNPYEFSSLNFFEQVVTLV